MSLPLAPDISGLGLIRLRSLGDAVLATALLGALRAARPRMRLVLVLEAEPAALLRGHPDIDEIVVSGRTVAAKWAALRELRRRRLDAVLDLHGGSTAALLTRLSGARRRIGLGSFRHRWAYHDLIDLPREEQPRHTVERNLAIARALGADPGAAIGPSLRIGEAAARAAERALGQAGLGPGERFLVVHPRGAMPSKTWRLDRFLDLVRALAERGETVLVPLPIASTIPPPAARVKHLEPVPIEVYAAVLARARLFIGNDGGPAHIAAALGVPAIAVFGSQDPRVWRPWPDGVGITRALPCHPCPGHRCANPDPLECLESIGVEDVLQAALSRLAQR